MWIDQHGSEIIAAPECLRLVALAAKESRVGRLAINGGQTPLVVPLNFRIYDRQIMVRIGPGSLSETVPGSLVSFEVDRVDPEGNVAWSVLIRGLASALDLETPALEVGLVPQPLVPTPGDILVLIRPDVITGRRFHLLAAEPAAS
jgi:uncharacterized protein